MGTLVQHWRDPSESNIRSSKQLTFTGDSPQNTCRNSSGCQPVLKALLRGQTRLEPHPDWCPLGASFKFSDEHSHPCQKQESSLQAIARPLLNSHLVQNKLIMPGCKNNVNLWEQRNLHQLSLALVCFERQLAPPRHGWFCIMWPGHASSIEQPHQVYVKSSFAPLPPPFHISSMMRKL